MNKLITAICLSIAFSVAIFAQDASSEEYNKNEYYVGYTNQQTGNFDRSSFHGIEAAYTRNVHRWFGIRADFSYARNDRTFFFSLPDPAGGTAATFRQENFRSVTQFLGGIQIKDNASKKRFKPFAFALGGVAINDNKFKNLACTSTNCPASNPFLNNFTFRNNGFAGAFGGGLDIKINDRIDFRAIQADYNPIFSNSRVDNNFRFGVGFVFK